MNNTILDPRRLTPNPWNPNKMDTINEDKLKESLRIDGLQQHILIRTLPDGKKQILNGEHRVKCAISLKWKMIDCIDVGEITDERAKKATLLGNSRYGADDPILMAALLSDDDMISAEELLSTLPIDETTLAAFFEHAAINLDDIDLDELGEDIDLEIPQTNTKTTQVLRFKLSIDDANTITDLISRTKHEEGLTESDDLTNAGDALIFLIGQIG